MEENRAGEGLEHQADEKQLKGAGGTQPAEKEAQQGPFYSLQLPEMSLQPGRVGFSSQVTSDRTRANSLVVCWGGLD